MHLYGRLSNKQTLHCNHTLRAPPALAFFVVLVLPPSFPFWNTAKKSLSDYAKLM